MKATRKRNVKAPVRAEPSYPEALLSVYWSGRPDNSTWCLLRCGFRRVPEWASTECGSRWAIYREIGYLDADSRLQGIGRSWILWSDIACKLLIKCFNPFQPLPLGEALKSILAENIVIEALANETVEVSFVAYRNQKESCLRFRRVIKSKQQGVTYAFAEEELSESMSQGLSLPGDTPC